ncbi:unnamed protein product [Oppiella nova]|uniref:PID domain-containing protein n=1 Tax=Oppiella nova TaxID=334625 RepID=A0A7R9QLW3_9ACAR|nr:unnamed protein product [Oppiella nova]CAG2168189.1 unnamed protein product [Oppiella nova]
MGNKQTAHTSLNRSHNSGNNNNHILAADQAASEPHVANDLRLSRRKKLGMDRLRRSLRESFRRKKDHIPESSKPHQWQADEAGVKAGTCVFPVKYLGCVEVFESRGMQVCEEALKVLRSSRRRALKGTLFVTGDGLRVVDDETKGLIVDQTIEKVSFCAPDRSHERGFSYICRDGTTRRWMCHGFNAGKDSGERLSHAVGCAFAVCLERKQKRDKETVSMNFDPKTSTFTRNGSFRQSSLTERMVDPQVAKPTDPPPLKQVHNPFAVERPHATPNLLQRQGSLRGGALNTASPFKRQLSLRVNDLPSNQERQRAHSVDLSANRSTVMPIPESSPANEPSDSISAMCQELSKGLTILSNNDDPFLSPTTVVSPTQSLNTATNSVPEVVDKWSPLKQLSNNYTENWINDSSKAATVPTESTSPVPQSAAIITNNSSTTTTTANPSIAALLNSEPVPSVKPPVAAPRHNSPNLSQLRQHRSLDDESVPVFNAGGQYPYVDPKLKYYSDYGNNHTNSRHTYQPQRNNSLANTGVSDPFDAEWAAISARHHQQAVSRPRSTNPFTQTAAPVTAFEVQM